MYISSTNKWFCLRQLHKSGIVWFFYLFIFLLQKDLINDHVGETKLRIKKRFDKKYPAQILNVFDFVVENPN